MGDEWAGACLGGGAAQPCENIQQRGVEVGGEVGERVPEVNNNPLYVNTKGATK